MMWYMMICACYISRELHVITLVSHLYIVRGDYKATRVHCYLLQ
jgi:hypothetical protein